MRAEKGTARCGGEWRHTHIPVARIRIWGKLTDPRTRMRRSWAMYMNVDASSNLVIPGQVLQQVRLLDPDPLVPSCRRTLDSSDFERAQDADGCGNIQDATNPGPAGDAAGTVHKSPDRPQLQHSDTHSHSSRSGCSHNHPEAPSSRARHQSGTDVGSSALRGLGKVLLPATYRPP